jgi:hypothetical protein
MSWTQTSSIPLQFLDLFPLDLAVPFGCITTRLMKCFFALMLLACLLLLVMPLLNGFKFIMGCITSAN